jgi:hypothetical protein
MNSNVNPDRLLKNNVAFAKIISEQFSENSISFFEEWEALIEEYKRYENIAYVTVGEVFRHNEKNCTLMSFSDRYRDGVISQVKKKAIPVSFDGIAPLKEYVIQEDTNDRLIQTKTESTPMSIKKFLLVKYALLVEPELGKQYLGYELSKDNNYLFHVKLDDGTVLTILLYRSCSHWAFDAFPFGRIDLSFRECVFLFFPIIKK